MYRLLPAMAASAACCLILASCALTPGDYKPVTDAAEFGPHSFLHNIYYCGSDAQNHYFVREMKTWWAPASSYFKIDRTLATYTPEKPFSPKRSQWDSITATPRFLKPATSAWPILGHSSPPAVSTSPNQPD